MIKILNSLKVSDNIKKEYQTLLNDCSCLEDYNSLLDSICMLLDSGILTNELTEYFKKELKQLSQDMYNLYNY